MKIEPDMTFGQWKHKRFWRLLYWYLRTAQNFDDWNNYCALQFYSEKRTEALS